MVKQLLRERMLKNALSGFRREKAAGKFNFADVKKAGILFDAAEQEDFELVKRYVTYLREHGKKVKALGFFSAKEIPDFTYSKLEYDFFSLKDLRFPGRPAGHIIDNFIKDEFDVLIDLNIRDHFPLHYVSSLSHAVFKIGKYSKANLNIMDMMIDADNTKTLKYFLRQVDTYMTMLNNPASSGQTN